MDAWQLTDLAVGAHVGHPRRGRREQAFRAVASAVGHGVVSIAPEVRDGWRFTGRCVRCKAWLRFNARSRLLEGGGKVCGG